VTAILLGYDDIEIARDFFVTALGFVEEWSRVADDGTLARSHVRFEDTVLLDKPGAHGVMCPPATWAVSPISSS
jgi:hypothetical protein